MWRSAGLYPGPSSCFTFLLIIHNRTKHLIKVIILNQYLHLFSPKPTHIMVTISVVSQAKHKKHKTQLVYTCSLMFLWATLQDPLLVMKRALWDLVRVRLGWFWSSASRVNRNPSGRRPFLANMTLLAQRQQEMRTQSTGQIQQNNEIFHSSNGTKHIQTPFLKLVPAPNNLFPSPHSALVRWAILLKHNSFMIAEINLLLPFSDSSLQSWPKIVWGLEQCYNTDLL